MSNQSEQEIMASLMFTDEFRNFLRQVRKTTTHEERQQLLDELYKLLNKKKANVLIIGLMDYFMSYMVTVNDKRDLLIYKYFDTLKTP